MGVVFFFNGISYGTRHGDSFHGIYPLVMTNIAMGNGPFIDGLPINSMVIFHGYVSHNQMVMEINGMSWDRREIYLSS